MCEVVSRHEVGKVLVVAVVVETIDCRFLGKRRLGGTFRLSVGYGAPEDLRPMLMAGRMTMSEPARRLELFTGAGRGRTWSDEEKAAIVAESDGPRTSISAVARRHGLSASQLFTWRRLASQAGRLDDRTTLRSVPVVLSVGRRLCCIARRTAAVVVAHPR